MTSLTAFEARALSDIVRMGGGLAGGRQNTRVQNRLAAEGLIRRTNDVLGYVATPAGEVLTREGNRPS